ncbi:MAG: fused MFS/spermidine synthase [Elusimicrobiota bacterium]|nr:fused MFS/spermidine synthase [Elusimicrobiota bacterium]
MRKPPAPDRSVAPAGYLAAGLFVSGACSLVIELAAARLIAPYYGTSLHVWSAVITVTMVALAVGYAWGGRRADRDPHLLLFARLLTAAGLTTAALPWLRGPVLKSSAALGVSAGAVVSAAALIGPVLVLLGALGPLVARLRAAGAYEVGRRSGDAWAVSTAGSVFGAALAGFALVPHLPLPRILLGTAAALLALGAWGSWLATRRAPLVPAGAFAAALLMAARPTPAPREPVLFAAETRYGRLTVAEFNGKRMLLMDGASQSTMRVADGETSSPYVHGLEWAAAARPRAASALVIGLGGGGLVRGLQQRGLGVDAVELDPGVVAAARDWFGLDPKTRVIVGDGRAALSSGGPWDLVFLDAFGAESPPAHLFTREAFLQARAALSPGGAFAVNLVTAVDGRDDRAWRSVRRTLAEVFPHVRAFVGSDPSEGLANVLFFASEAPLEAPASAARPAAREAVAEMLSRELPAGPPHEGGALLLTDDHAPLEALLSASALRWRRLIQRAVPEDLLL